MAITLVEDVVNRFIVNSPADHTVEEYSGNTNVSAINSVLVYSRKENVKVFARVTATQVWQTLGVVGNDLDSVSGHGTEYRKDAVFNVTTMDRVSIISLGAETNARIVFNPSLPTEGLENAGGLTSMGGTMTDHILPDTNAAYDLGSAEYKIRHLFLSNNSLWIGDTHKVSISGGKMKFRKRKTSTVPPAVAAASGDEAAALAHAGVASLGDMKLEHWREFMRTLPGQSAAEIKDIFRDNSEDYEDDFEAGAASGGSSTSQTIVSDMAQNQVETIAIASGTTPVVQVYEDIVIPGAGSTELDVLRLHLDSGFTDSSDSGHTPTVNGGMAISTSSKKFGAGSMALDGSNDFLSMPDSADWDFGTNDLTVEFWAYHSGGLGTWDAFFELGHIDHYGLGVWANASGQLRFHIPGAGSGDFIDTAASAFTTNAWHHMAITRENNLFRLFVDGTKVAEKSTTASCNNNHNNLFHIGQAAHWGGYKWAGYMDDFRVTKGLARYTANFSVPTAAHPDANAAGTTRTLDKSSTYEIEHASDTTVEVKKLTAGSANVKIRII